MQILDKYFPTNNKKKRNKAKKSLLPKSKQIKTEEKEEKSFIEY